MHDLITAILEGDCTAAIANVRSLGIRGVTPEYIVLHGVEAAMQVLDSKCTLEQFNLLEIMLAGRAVMEVMRVLYPAGTAMPATKGTVVIATLEGDVHDLGKNILKMVLIANGYRVVDCGKDCPLERFLHDVEEERPFAVGISGLITTVIPLVRQVKGLLRRHQLERVKVMAGGAALKQSTPDRLQVDYVAESAFDALHYLDELMGGGA